MPLMYSDGGFCTPIFCNARRPHEGVLVFDDVDGVPNSFLEDDAFRQRRTMQMITLSSYNQFKSWAEEFDQALLEQKKMIAASFSKKLRWAAVTVLHWVEHDLSAVLL